MKFFVIILISLTLVAAGCSTLKQREAVLPAAVPSPEAEALFNDSTKDVGLNSSYGPREYPVTALLYGLEPRQPIAQLHDVSHLIARWLLHLIRPNLSPTTT